MALNTTPTSPLYARPLRVPTLIAQSLVVFWNSILFIWCCITSHTIFYSNNSYYTGWTRDPSYTLIRFILFLFWTAIPLVVWANSTFELYKRWRRTLAPRRIVFTGSFSIVLWLTAIGYWSPCVFSSYWEGENPYDVQPKYCPFLKGPDWRRPYQGPLNPPPRAYYLIPWFVIPVLIFYVFYVTLGAIAFNRERRVDEMPCGLCERCGGQGVVYEKRYKVTSSLYTDVDIVSNPGPSTLRSSMMSPEPSARPPSYGNLSSTRTSLRSMEKTHAREFGQ